MGLVSKNYEIECAIVELEKELIELRRRKEAEAKTSSLSSQIESAPAKAAEEMKQVEDEEKKAAEESELQPEAPQMTEAPSSKEVAPSETGTIQEQEQQQETMIAEESITSV